MNLNRKQDVGGKDKKTLLQLSVLLKSLPKIPAAENINLDENGNTVGIF